MAKLKMCQMYGDKPNKGAYDNGVYQDIFQIPFIQNENDLEPYDVIINTLWLDATMTGRNKRIKTRWPNKTLLGLSDHPLSTHISKMPAENQLRYLEDISYVDGIMALTEEEREWYQVALPSKPVMKIGLPFPFEAYEKTFGHLRGSEKKYIGLGVGASDNDRNFISSWLVFNRLKLDYPDIIGVFLSVPDFLIPYCSQLADAAKDVFIQQRDDMATFYDTLSQCSFVINLADRNTPGRLQGEAAFFGVPVIGSERLELQRELFPELSIKPYELEQACNLASLFLDGIYKPSDKPYKKLEHYSYRASKIRVNKLLKLLKEA